MGNKSCIDDYSEKKEIVTDEDQRGNQKYLNEQNTQKEQGGGEEQNDENSNIYLGNKIFKSGIKTEITTLNKEYKEISELSFNERKKIAKDLIQELNIESIIQASDYDNTSFNIISKNDENNELSFLFFKNASKAMFEALILDILNSADWDGSTLSEKFNKYNLELNSRIKFNQPIDVDNEVVFFYKSKIHILIKLVEKNDESNFKKELGTKSDVYKAIGMNKIIKNNQYPKESCKLKLLMLILILIENRDQAIYMYNSICDENKEVEYYYNKILELKLVDKNKISYDNNSLFINNSFYNKDIYSFESLIHCLKIRGINKIFLNNESLYKYDYFVNNYWITEYLNKFKEIIKIIIK